MKALPFLALFLVACGPANPDGDGLSAFESEAVGIQRQQLASALVHSGFAEKDSKAYMAEASVDWMPGRFVSQGHRVDGWTDNLSVRVARKPCIWDSAYRHEMFHVILEHQFPFMGDPGHTHKAWKEVDNLPGYCVSYSGIMESKGY